MNNIVLEVSSVTVTLGGKTILKDINFTLNHGNHLAILGSSGAGKSVLAKALAGKIFYQGSIIFDPGKLNRIGFMPQQHFFKNKSNTIDMYYQQRFNALDAEDALTVLEVIPDLSTNSQDIIHALNIGHILNQPLLQLSNGEHKKLQLARIMSARPALMIMDEPFVGLDKSTREDLHRFIASQINQGVTFILVTSPNEIPRGIDHLLIVDQGKVISFEEKLEAFNAVPKKPEKEEYALNEFSPLQGYPSSYPFKYAVKMNDVSVTYGDKIVIDHIQWEVKQGEKWMIIGPNGSGKSTLLSLLNGDHPQAYANDIILFDKLRGSGESIWDIKKRIGYLSPELHMYFDKGVTVFDAIASGWFDSIGLFKKLTTAQIERIHHWITFAGMAGLEDNTLAQLSFGQQRLVLLIRALVKQPALLILDEPLQGLKDHQQHRIVNWIDQWCKLEIKTLIFVSHYPEVRPQCIERYIRLNNGRISEEASVDQLI